MAPPSIYTRELFAELCNHIADGKSLRTIEKMENMPGLTTVFRWLSDSEHVDSEWIRERYARAKEHQADTGYEEILEIAERVMAGEVGYNEGRLAIDARKWGLSKLKPKKYGDKIKHDHSGGVQVEVVRFSDKGPEKEPE